MVRNTINKAGQWLRERSVITASLVAVMVLSLASSVRADEHPDPFDGLPDITVEALINYTALGASIQTLFSNIFVVVAGLVVMIAIAFASLRWIRRAR